MSLWSYVTGGAQNFGEYLYLLSLEVKAVLGDKDAQIHFDSLQEVNARKTKIDQQIFQIVESEKVAGPRIPFFSDVVDGIGGAFSGVGKLVKFLGKYSVVLIVLAGIVAALYFLGPLKRMVKK